MPVRFYYEPGKTGFEASTEYAAVPDELIIGRYKIVKFLGELPAPRPLPARPPLAPRLAPRPPPPRPAAATCRG